MKHVIDHLRTMSRKIQFERIRFNSRGVLGKIRSSQRCAHALVFTYKRGLYGEKTYTANRGHPRSQTALEGAIQRIFAYGVASPVVGEIPGPQLGSNYRGLSTFG